MRTPSQVVVVTSTRAEWGLLAPVVHALDERLVPSGRRVAVLCGGSHLVAEQGDTIEEVRQSVRVPVHTVDFIAGDRPVVSRRDMAETIGRATLAFTAAFGNLEPDLVVVLGDRYEILAAATAASALGITLAHLEGGHVTLGAADEKFRHAITKLADVHFPATNLHRDRLFALGEQPERIVVSGPLGVANLLSAPSLPPAELAGRIGIDPAARPTLVVTYHPETESAVPVASAVEAMLEGIGVALDRRPDAAAVFTAANLDPGGELINAAKTAFSAARPGQAVFHPSLGVTAYVNLLRLAAGCVGNSSSGLLEAAALGLPVVNVGDRQKGRDAYGPVIHVPTEAAAIADAVHAILSGPAPSVGRVAPFARHPAAVIADAISALDLDAMRTKPPPVWPGRSTDRPDAVQTPPEKRITS